MNTGKMTNTSYVAAFQDPNTGYPMTLVVDSAGTFSVEMDDDYKEHAGQETFEAATMSAITMTRRLRFADSEDDAFRILTKMGVY